MTCRGGHMFSGDLCSCGDEPIPNHLDAMQELFRSSQDDAKVLADIVDDLRQSIVAALCVLPQPDVPAGKILRRAFDKSTRDIAEWERTPVPGDEDDQ